MTRETINSLFSAEAPSSAPRRHGSLGATGQAATNDTTWIFNLSKQSWTEIPTSAAINVPLLETYEQDDFGSRNLSNQVTARAVFGYAAVQGLAVNAMSNLIVGTQPLSLPWDSATPTKLENSGRFHRPHRDHRRRSRIERRRDRCLQIQSDLRA